ncbi:hypothetical protein ADIS_2934 [Lunatimonas lonarensis]|uniref:ER-bound oxygenase mpaB/mpaB'/Rubber oxygenase catalytic domain-containing protein n=2 Tax=Lunatimonas lonarensis TaxID=1232681 RepID=R7ZR38_9BACT|nr:hypothetical protein ADIS_2934 [Lunatimonas lonarensis]
MPVALADFFEFYYHSLGNPEPEKMLRARYFFEKKAKVYLSLLGFYALPYTYAFADGAQVLVRSKRIVEDTGRRLDETFYFVLEAFRPAAFLEQNETLLTAAKVRLIHAFSRYFVQKHAKDWDPAWGLPINQEDLLGTNLAFSLIVLRGFSKLGLAPCSEDVEAILYYWKYIGMANGVDTRYWPDNAKQAYWLEKRIRERHVRPSEAGRLLTRKLLAFYQHSLPNRLPRQVIDGIVAYFLGPQLSDAVGISSRVPIPDLVYGFIFNSNFFGPSGDLDTYAGMRRFFDAQTTKKYGQPLGLTIPELRMG